MNYTISNSILWMSLEPAVMSVCGLNPFSMPTLLVGSILSIILYFVFVWKPNIYKDLADVGFDYLKDGGTNNVGSRSRSKRELVRDVQKRRAIGELPPIYPNGWFVLLESSDVRPGEVKAVSALGETFAVFRSSEGKIFVLDAYCPHLGANMAIGGSVHGDCLECPFHKWRFDGVTGDCSSVPYSSGSLPNANAKSWLSAEVNQFIFVWYHAEGNKPDWFIHRSTKVADGTWSYQGRSEMLVGCHIQEIPENGADIGHLNALHGATTVAGADLRFCERQIYKFARHKWIANWRQSEQDPHVGLLDITIETRLLENFVLNRMDTFVQQVGPGYVELTLKTPFGDILLLQSVTPVGPMEQRVLHRIFSSKLVAPVAKAALYLETIMLQRDIMVWNHKKYLSKPYLVKEDRTILRHRRWYQQFYSENSPKFQFTRDSLEW